MKKLLLCFLCCLLFKAGAQVASTYNTNALAMNIICQHTITNLTSAENCTNTIWQGRNVGIGVSFIGGASTNTGTIGFQFAVLSKSRGVLTTTRPVTFTSTANGTTGVSDWFVLPNYTLGPADSLVLVGITNALVNVNAGYTSGSVTVSNIWLQFDTRP